MRRQSTGRILVLTGTFFQKSQKLIKKASEMESGACVYMTELNYSAVFFGTLQWSSSERKYMGKVQDIAGKAILTDVVITDDEIRFVKTYTNRKDSILYVLRPTDEEGLWTGTYQGDLVGRGFVNVVVKDVPMAFFSAIIPCPPRRVA